MTTTIRRLEQGRRTAGLLDVEANVSSLCRRGESLRKRDVPRRRPVGGPMADFDGSVSQIDVSPSDRMPVWKRELHAVFERETRTQ
jgi:hypothetical protein